MNMANVTTNVYCSDRSENNLKHLCCLVCTSKKIAPLQNFYETKGLVKCSDCGFVYMEAIPTSEELFEFYKGYAYTEDEVVSALTVKSYNSLLDEFEQYRQTNKILDVGTGRGFFLDQAKKRGWEVYGTEFSEKAIELCESKGLQMKAGVLSSASFGDITFDVVTSFEVLEHINTPNEELKEISALIREGGLFYCTTPNFNSLMRYYLKDKYNIIVYPEHLSYYTKKTLNHLMSKHQLKNKKFLTTGISFSRIQQSQQVDTAPQRNTDDKLRENIYKKPYLNLAKNIVNNLLTLTSTGMTLKGYYTKQSD